MREGELGEGRGVGRGVGRRNIGRSEGEKQGKKESGRLGSLIATTIRIHLLPASRVGTGRPPRASSLLANHSYAPFLRAPHHTN